MDPGGGDAAAQELPRHGGGQRGGHAAPLSLTASQIIWPYFLQHLDLKIQDIVILSTIFIFNKEINASQQRFY